MSLKYQREQAIEKMTDAIADMNQVYESLSDASLHAQASNIISNEDADHALEGEARGLMVTASNLRSEIGDILSEYKDAIE